MTDRRRGAIASPDRRATEAGCDVLAAGGNAVDAAVAAGLVLSVVAPYHCGLGGDVLALVWDGTPHGLISAGGAPAAADADAVRAAVDVARASGHPASSLPGTAGMPDTGALSVTVPGAVDGWLALLDTFGSWDPARVLGPAIRSAEEGTVVTPYAEDAARASRGRLGREPGWEAAFGGLRAGELLVQPALARTLRRIGADGRDAFYAGPMAEAIADTLAAQGSAMRVEDLSAHRPEWVAPLTARYRGREVLELPPPTQGVTALTALAVLDAVGPLPSDEAQAVHLQIEALRLALADREQYVGDPRGMGTTSEELLDPGRIARMGASIDRDHAMRWPPARPAPGGTAYVCAADGDGLLVSLIQSNFRGFGSGVVVDAGGFGLNDRGAHLSLDPAAPNAYGPGRRPLHTLIPALVLHDRSPRFVMGTMGGDAQPQVHVQLLGHLLDRGLDLAAALEAPRFVIDVADGSVGLEPALLAGIGADLRARGHDVRPLASAGLAGHAHLIDVDGMGATAVASDPRCDGSAASV